MHLRNDDFEAFYKSRSQELGTLIANAMGKPVVEDHGKNEKELEVSDMTDIEIELEEKQEAV
jgi:hypothetical protein